MALEGINIRCNIGPYEVLRTPRLRILYRRSALVSRAEIDLPDPDGSIASALNLGDSCRLRFWYRGGNGLSHDFHGVIDGFAPGGPRTIRVLIAGREIALLKTLITESYHKEPADLVARRILTMSGFDITELGIPNDILPHIVFSRVSIAVACRQIRESLERAFGHDLSKHALWLGGDGLRWSDGFEPGDTYVVASAENLIEHTPVTAPKGLSRIVSVPLPGLTHSMRVQIRDAHHKTNALVKAQEVEHLLEDGQNRTTILYGGEYGWY